MFLRLIKQAIIYLRGGQSFVFYSGFSFISGSKWYQDKETPGYSQSNIHCPVGGFLGRGGGVGGDLI